MGRRRPGGLGLLQEGGGLHQQALIYVGEQMAGKLLCLKKMHSLFQFIFFMKMRERND